MARGSLHIRIQDDILKHLDNYMKDGAQCWEELTLINGKRPDIFIEHKNGLCSIIEVKTYKEDCFHGQGLNFYADYNMLAVPYHMIEFAKDFLDNNFPHVGILAWTPYGILWVRNPRIYPEIKVPKGRSEKSIKLAIKKMDYDLSVPFYYDAFHTSQPWYCDRYFRK